MSDGRVNGGGVVYFERQNHVWVRNEERANGGSARYHERRNHALVRNKERANGGMFGATSDRIMSRAK